MRRTALLIVLAAALLGTAGAAVAANPTPRGTLSKVEYQELQASYEALKHAGKLHGTLTYIARHSCRALTNVSRLTAAERGECEASLIYTYEFFGFPYEVEHCAKDASAPAQARCLLNAINAFEKSVRAFIRTNAASARAAGPRHFTRRCLEYLLFTRPQARATNALSTGLRRYARAVRSGSARRITAAGTRVDSDMVTSRQAMSFNISLSVCRHE